MTVRHIRKPYLLLIGDMENPLNAKTAFGLRDWAPEACVGQCRFNEKAVDLGLPELSPQEAAQAGACTLILGIAPPGGQLPESWHSILMEALRAGLDLASGLHQRLSEVQELYACASAYGRQIHDVRHSQERFPVASGQRRSGRRLLTVGTDCALGKKYTALAIAKEMAARGRKVDFRATGQTGILIAGSGIAIDAVGADFIAGAAEVLSPAGAADHWDIIEGQGSLFHPAYAGVTLGLLHGSQPDALVLCHDPTRKSLSSFPDFRVAATSEAIPAYLSAARLTNPLARFVGVAFNTSTLTERQAMSIMRTTEDSLELPCVDPIRTGVVQIVEALERIDAS